MSFSIKPTHNTFQKRINSYKQNKQNNKQLDSENQDENQDRQQVQKVSTKNNKSSQKAQPSIRVSSDPSCACDYY